MFTCVDGIYPQCCRFVKGFKEPITAKEQVHSGWQESTRKDIERAFGVLQAKFQFMARPMRLHHLTDVSSRVGTCLTLHNMCVSDRVMEGDVRAVCRPSNGVPQDPVQAEALPAKVAREQATVIGVANMSEQARRLSIAKKEWHDLRDVEEQVRLHEALKECHFSIRKN